MGLTSSSIWPLALAVLAEREPADLLWLWAEPGVDGQPESTGWLLHWVADAAWQVHPRWLPAPSAFRWC